MNKGGYFVEIDTDADHHYEGSGIGRVQKLGAPPQICLSSGFASLPNFIIDVQNSTALSLCASCLVGEKIYIGANGKYSVDLFETKDNECVTELTCIVEDKAIAEKISVSKNGVEIIASADADKVGVEIPDFAFDGVEKSHIKMTDKEMTVEYKCHTVRYTTNGRFFDLKEEICNRNGRYRRFRAVGEGSVSVKIEID